MIILKNFRTKDSETAVFLLYILLLLIRFQSHFYKNKAYSLPKKWHSMKWSLMGIVCVNHIKSMLDSLLPGSETLIYIKVFKKQHNRNWTVLIGEVHTGCQDLNLSCLVYCKLSLQYKQLRSAYLYVLAYSSIKWE